MFDYAYDEAEALSAEGREVEMREGGPVTAASAPPPPQQATPSPVGGVVRMLIDGVEESIRLDTQHRLQSPQSELLPLSSSHPHPPPARARPVKAASSSQGKAPPPRASGGRGGPSPSTQLTFSSSTPSLSLTQPSPVLSAVSLRSAVDVSEESSEDERVKGKVPALFHPRSREVQRRMSSQVTSQGKRKATVRPAGGAATSGGGASGRGKRRAAEDPQAMQSTSSAPLEGSSRAGSERRGAGVQGGVASSREEGSQSRFASCPVCGQSQPIALMNHHLDVECGGAEAEQRQPPAGPADKQRRLQPLPAAPAPPPPPDGQPQTPSPSASTLTAALPSTTAASTPARTTSPATSTSSEPLHSDKAHNSPSSASSSPAPSTFAELPSPRSALTTLPPTPPPSAPPALSVFSADSGGVALSSASAARTAFLSPQRRPPAAVVGPYRSPLRPSASRSTFRIEDGQTPAPVRDTAPASQSSENSPNAAASASGEGETSASTISHTTSLTSSISPSPQPPSSAVSGDCGSASAAPGSGGGDDASASASAASSGVHPLFSRGSVSGAAFAARRRGRLDGVQPSASVHCHLRYQQPHPTSASASDSSDSRQLSGPLPLSPTTAGWSSPLCCWEVQWLDVAATASTFAVSPASTSLTRCTQRFQEPDTGAVTEVHFTCDAAVYQHPTVDFTSPQLLANHTRSTTHPTVTLPHSPYHRIHPSSLHSFCSTASLTPCLAVMRDGCAGASICLHLT